MEFEERNPKPKNKFSNTPTLLLIGLFTLVLLLLYGGWNLMSDDASNITDLKTLEKSDDKQVDTDLVTGSPDENVVEEVTVEEIPVPATAPVIAETPKTVVETSKTLKTETPKPAPVTASATYSGETALHTVRQGETFFGIGNKFNTGQNTLKSLNPDVNPEGIKIGVTKIKVPVQAVHTVGPGDVLRVVAGKYNVSIDAIMAANGKTKNYAERGEKLLIPHKTKQ